ncbi:MULTISPECIES: hypothetical protein [Bacillus]|uniref:hypothetical protein n=1 Tax=Bacillus TaxID=1386 RepID=UPI0006AF95C9|nr:hypothetical protein [Bacillus gobiensis]
MKSNKTQAPVPLKSEMRTEGIPYVKQILVKALRYGGPTLVNFIKKIPYKWAQKAGEACAKLSGDIKRLTL